MNKWNLILQLTSENEASYRANIHPPVEEIKP